MTDHDQPTGGVGRAWPRRWRLWSLPKPVIAYVLTVDIAAIALVAATLSLTEITRQHWIWLALLLGGSVLHLEAARGIERIREIAAEGSPHTHMQTVWIWAATLVLPPPMLAAVIAVSYLHSWIRVYRCRAIPHRKAFSAATVVLACAAASLALAVIPTDTTGPGMARALTLDGPLALAGLAAAGLLYWLINYALVVGVLLLTNPAKSGRSVLGHGSDQLIILASVGLGSGIALIMTTRPWWTPLLIVTVLALHMGLLLPQFRAAARTDGKTSLLDAAFWASMLDAELGRAQRLPGPAGTVGVLLVDLDHFRDINNTHGHLAGDQVLRAVADALKHAVRGYDLVGRYGGEEFAIALPGITTDQIPVVAERVRVSVATLTVTVQVMDGSHHAITGLTASIGAAVYPAHATTRTDLLLAADAALYRAKNGGRDRVELATPA